jgi:Spy/CpxP family protein refolding chaperone
MGTSSPEAHLQMLSEKLNLTEDQKAKLKPIFQDQAQQLKRSATIRRSRLH